MISKWKQRVKWLLGFTQRTQLHQDLDLLNQQVQRLRERVLRLQQLTADIRTEQFRLRSAFLDQWERELLASPRYQDPRRLAHYEHQVFSQSGEDGIIAEIFRRIGITTHTFVEIGVGDGLQNNTAYLLLQGWQGVWVEGDEKAVARIRSHFQEYLDAGRLRLVHAFVTAENITTLLAQSKVPQEFDFLSIDIDRNTYWVWAALDTYRPRAVCVEYNAIFPPDVDWKVDYEPMRLWNKSSYFGASLLAYERLGRRLGYNLVGCSLSGINAFFVRSDLCTEDLFVAPFTAENHYEPHRSYIIRRIGRPRQFHDNPS